MDDNHTYLYQNSYSYSMEKYFVAILICFAGSVSAQVKIDPIIGYGFDLTNHGSKLNEFNTAIRIGLPAKAGRYYAFLLLEYGMPLNITKTDTGYTTNPSLPVSTLVNEKIGAKTIAGFISQCILLYGNNNPNKIYLIINLGVCSQIIKPHYTVNPEYTILNPDVTKSRISPSVGGGVEYAYRKGGFSNFFLQLTVQSAAFEKKNLILNDNYHNPFLFPGYLSFRLGYSLPLSKKK